MAKKTPLDKLASDIEAILDDYAEDVKDNLSDITEAIGKKGVQALRGQSRSSFGGTGKYASGWKAKVEKGRLDTTVTLYNSKVPGLPHLLEFGHAKRGGGRTSGTAHIEPVEQELIRTFEKEVKVKL